MAIQDKSNLNNLLAESLKNNSRHKLYSGDTMSPETQNEINQIIREGNENRDPNGEVPIDVYEQVAELMLPTTPGMNKKTLVQSLKVNRNFNGSANRDKSTMDNVLQGTREIAKDKYDQQLARIKREEQQQLNQYGLNGVLPNITEDLTNQITNIVNESILGFENTDGQQIRVGKETSSSVASILTGSGKVSDTQLSDFPDLVTSVLGASDGVETTLLQDITNKGQELLAGGLIKNVTDAVASATEIGAEQGKIRGTIAGTIAQSDDLPKPPPYEIGSDRVNPGGNNIASVEELEAEMGSMTRPISEIIVHWSETFTNANLNARDLDTVTGAGASAYHLIVMRDGTVQRGVPMNSVGNHCATNGHNTYSIGVCLVGGLNVASGTDDLYEATSARGITHAQFNSLYQIFRTFYDQYPGGQALGHGEIDPSQDDPGFDVRDYVYNNFNKTSLYLDPQNDPALSPDDILAALEGQGPDILTKDPDVLEKNF